MTNRRGEPRAIGSWIERRARSRPDRPALISGDRIWTYGELAARIRRLARAFRALGVVRGDRVAWIGENHPAFIESLFAVATVGGALAPVNPRLDPQRIAAQLEDAAPSLVLRRRDTPDAAFPDSVDAVVDVDAAGDGDLEFETLIEGASDEPIAVEVALDDVCLVPFTSGTTGASKGVMLTHDNVTWNVVNFLTSADFRTDDVTIAVAPFFRAGGTGVNVLPVLFLGGTVVVPQHGDPDELLRLTERHRATIGFANPDLLEALTRSRVWSTVDLSALRTVMTGGAPVPHRLIRTSQERGVSVLQGYGLSEAGPLVLLMDPDRALEKVGAAGRPAPFVDIRIVSPGGADVATGETGELLVRGPNVMAGYLNRPDATRATIDPDGWLHTGDAARIDDDGDFWIVDRVKDAFILGGGIVYPGDIERAILDHPGVSDAAVAGVPEPDGRTAVSAFVVLEEGATVTQDAILRHSAKSLSADALPRTVTFVDRLPRSSVGKLLRAELETLLRAMT